jgi:hypothetical protein
VRYGIEERVEPADVTIESASDIRRRIDELWQ